LELSTSPDSQDENGRQAPASESEYEDASQGKRKKRDFSGELRPSKKRTSPVDILPPTKGGPLSPLTVGSSTEEQDPPTPANKSECPFGSPYYLPDHQFQLELSAFVMGLLTSLKEKVWLHQLFWLR
jgi:hypothetical protein